MIIQLLQLSLYFQCIIYIDVQGFGSGGSFEDNRARSLDFEGFVSVLKVEVLKDLYLLHRLLVNDAADHDHRVQISYECTLPSS